MLKKSNVFPIVAALVGGGVIALGSQVRAGGDKVVFPEGFDKGVLFITHDLRVAAQVCDRIAVMHKGEVVEEGTTAAVFAAPKHDYTRALFDSAPGRNFEFGKFD